MFVVWILWAFYTFLSRSDEGFEIFRSAKSMHSFQCAVDTPKEREKVRKKESRKKSAILMYAYRIRIRIRSRIDTMIHNCIYFFLDIWINRFLFFALLNAFSRAMLPLLYYLLVDIFIINTLAIHNFIIV